MKAELRADGLHISGYVNVPGRKSRPVMTPRGKVIEVIEQGAFSDAIKRATEVRMLLDHNENRVLATTKNGTLKLKEDEIGLRAESVVTDAETIEGAKAGRLRGWSFGMRHVVDAVEERAGQLPVRRVKSFDMNEITLVMNRMPVYSSTSVEVRAEGEEDVETRAIYVGTEYTDYTTEKKPDYSDYENRIKELE